MSLTSVRAAIIKDERTSDGKDVEGRNLSTVGGNDDAATIWRKQYGGSSKNLNRATTGFSNSSSGYLPRESKTLTL